MIGFSFYLNDPDAEERLVRAHRQGVILGFTSLHIPEESGELADRAKRLLAIAQKRGIKVYADVSKHTPRHLGIGSLADLASLGVAGIRLDDAFSTEEITALSRQYRIALNASTISEAELASLLNSGLQPEKLIAWHNFYPRVETGLDDMFFWKQSELFHQHQIPLAAFVAGRGEKRGPLHEGLPTLERHRTVDPFIAAVELLTMGTDYVFIGDPEADDQLLAALVNYEKNRPSVPMLRVRSSVLKSGHYTLRPDLSRDVFRFVDTRAKGIAPDKRPTERPVGTLSVDNQLYGRYCGEMQIARHDLPADERVNVIGYIIPEDLPLLAMLLPGQQVLLQCVE